MQTMAGGSASSARYISYADEPLGVVSFQASLSCPRPRASPSCAPPLRDVEIACELRVTNVLGGVRDAVHEPVPHCPARRRPPTEGRLTLFVESAVEARERLRDPAAHLACAGREMNGGAFRDELRVAVA